VKKYLPDFPIAELEGTYLVWNTENVTVYDSEINGEYLGWHSKNLRLVNCKISGTQPLCYAHGLIIVILLLNIVLCMLRLRVQYIV
jgi:hypothetical protein